MRQPDSRGEWSLPNRLLVTVLTGSLGVFGLPDIFRLLSQYNLTGALKVARESGEGVVYFREGSVDFAFSSLTRGFLGQRLVTAKLITQGQLRRILDEQKKSPTKRMGDLLVAKDIVSAELLSTFIKEQIQDAIFDLLHWETGTFSVEEGEVSDQEIGLSVSVENLIMESSRRIEEWELIRRRIPNLDVVVRMAPTPPASMEINIKPEEWTLLVLSDGQRTVRDIAAASERPEFEACKIIYGLVSTGLLDVASGQVRLTSEDAAGPTIEDIIFDEVTALAASAPEELEFAPPRAVTPPPPAPEPVEQSEPESVPRSELAEPAQAPEGAVDKATLMRLIAGVRNL